MISDETLRIAEETAAELRERGAQEQAQAIEALLEVARDEAIPALDLLTSTQAGDLLGVSGQTIKNWARQGRLAAYRVGGRIMVPKDAVADYVRRARTSLDLTEVSDDEAERLVSEGRTRR
jgi:excisionase family DNA binding protein